MASSTKARRKYWNAWVQYTNYIEQSPCQDKCIDDSIVALTGFAARVHSEVYGRSRQVGVQTVTDALGAMVTTFKLVGKSSPTHIESLQRQIKKYRREDPPPKPQLVLHVTVAEKMMPSGYLPKATPIEVATGELGLVAFYYLLRVGEYTIPTSNLYWDGGSVQEVRAARTIQFRLKGITFWRQEKILKRWKMFHLANEATIKLTNQKSGIQNDVIHHQALSHGKNICPVNAIAKRCRHVHRYGGNTELLLCDYWDILQWRQITFDNITLAVKVAVLILHLEDQGITPNDVGSYSLRAGGLMALKLNGVSDTLIKKAGRWTSMAFLQYIHSQLGHLSAGISLKMNNQVHFRNGSGKQDELLSRPAPTIKILSGRKRI